MNTNEFEKWLKNKLDEMPFEANKQGWDKLQKEMPVKKKTIFSILPMLKIAASLFILAVLSAALYFYVQNKPFYLPLASHTDFSSSLKRSINYKNDNFLPTPQSDIHFTAQTSPHKFRNSVNPNHNGNSHSPIHINWVDSVNNVLPIEPFQFVHEEKMKSNETKQNEIKSNEEPSLPPIYHNPSFDLYNSPTTNSPADYSIYAGMGTQNIGSFQYQAGISGKVYLNQYLAFEAAVGVRATQLSLGNSMTVNGMNVGGDITSGAESYMPVEKSVQTNYKAQILSIGASPAVYLRIHKKLSLSTGLYSFKNINTDIPLQESPNEFTSNLVKTGIVPGTQFTNEWDIGWTAGLEYQMSTLIKLDLQYLQGLNNYYATWNNSTKRNGLQLGLKIKFNK